MEYVILIGVFALFIGLIVMLFKWVSKLNKKKVVLFTTFSDKYGLQHSSTKYMLAYMNTVEGDIKGTAIHIYEKMVGSGKNQTVVTTLTISPTPFDFEFKIGKEHLFSKAGKMLGFKDIEMGDEEFDKTFLMKSKEEDKFKAMMTYDLQAQLTEISGALKGNILGNETNITYSFTGPIGKQTQMDQFESVMLFILKMCAKRR